jgi:retron-type reverse transcriptase
MDSIINNNATLNKRKFSTVNQRLLTELKHEIKVKNKILTPLLIKCIKQNIWPMLKYPKLIYELLELKQKYLSMLSLEYKFNSKIVNNQITEWICSLVLRIVAIETVYRSTGAKIPGIDGILLNSKNLVSFLNNLTFQYLLKKYKPITIKQRVFLAKSENCQQPIATLTVNERIIQTLFLLTIDPVLDPFTDTTNFAFRKGRTAHQAIGLVSRALHHKPKRKKKNKSTKPYFVNTKHVLKMDIKQFFSKAGHS